MELRVARRRRLEKMSPAEKKVRLRMGDQPEDRSVSSRDGKERDIQGSAKRLRPCLVKFLPVVAYHFCLNLPEALTKPGRSLSGPALYMQTKEKEIFQSQPGFVRELEPCISVNAL